MQLHKTKTLERQKLHQISLYTCPFLSFFMKGNMSTPFFFFFFFLLPYSVKCQNELLQTDEQLAKGLQTENDISKCCFI